MADKKFVFLTDLHYGFERRHGHKIALHDEKAMEVALQFVQDYQPDAVILGGDILDCGAVSHHNRGKPGKTEGLRILADGEMCHKEFIQPLLSAVPDASFTYLVGNHEAWLTQLEEELPGLDGMLKLPRLMALTNWTIIPEGEHHRLGKLHFIHGNQLSAADHCAKNAVINWGENIRFGHFHTHQTYTLNTPIHNQLGKTAMAVGCLCRKDPSYGKGRPNRWVQGINYGVVFHDGTFVDQHSVIINGKMLANGKVYKY